MSNKHNVWIGQCIKTIIFSMVAFLTILLPYSINEGVTFTLNVMPVLGNSTMIDAQYGVVCNFFALIRLPADSYFFFYIFKVNVIVFYSILIANVFFSLLLIVSQANFLRIIVRILSIIFSVFMFIISLSYFVTIVCIIYALFSGYYQTDILLSLKTCGIIYYFVTIFFSSILIRKQVEWFDKRTW